ncbi:MAG: hypothetical protein KDB00_24830 [Planctomycetales bacterium]|nr:hypothetical protein [Planctomycetales bacterium]
MVIKQGHLVVLGQDSGSLFFIDLNSNEVVGSLEFPDSKAQTLCASSVANDFVYCFNFTTGPDRALQMIQVDLRQRTVLRQTILAYPWLQNIHDAAISASGNWLLCSGYGTVAKHDVTLFKFDEEAMTVEAVNRVDRQVGMIRPDPQERYWLIGSKLYSLDLKKAIHSFGGAASCLHPTLDLAAAYANKQLNFHRISGGQWVSGVATDKEVRSPGFTNPLIAGRVVVDFDLANQAVFVGEQTRGTWVDLSELSPKPASRTMIKAPAEVVVDAGQQATIKLSLANANGFATQFRLIDAPQRASIVNDQLIWNPSVADFGDHRVRIGLTTGESEELIDEMTVNIRVEFPSQSLGFFPRAIEFSPDETLAILWGPKTIPAKHSAIANASSDADVVGLVDLKQNRMIKFNEVQAGIRCAAVDDKYVYIAPKSGQLLYRLNHAFAEPNKVFADSPIVRIIPYRGGRLLCTGPRPMVFDRDTLMPIDSRSEADRTSTIEVYATRDRQTMIESGRRIDRTSGEVLRYHAFRYLPTIKSQSSNQPEWKITPATRWGYSIAAGRLMDHQDHASKLMEKPSLVAISQRSPIVVYVQQTESGKTGLPEVVMHLRSLTDGRVLARGAIKSLAAIETYDSTNGNLSPMMNIVNDTIYLISGDQLTIVELPESLTGSLPWPVCFSRKQQLEIEYGGIAKFHANVDRQINLDPNALKPKLKFQTELITSAVQIDADSGEVSVDTEALWLSFAKQSLNPVSKSRPGVVLDPKHPEENAIRYQSLTGKQLPAGTYAVSIPISIVLTDETGRSDSARFSVLMCVPRDQYDEHRREAIEKRDASMKLLREKQELRRLANQIETEKHGSQSQSTGEPPIDEVKLAELERRAGRVEAALDTILTRLQSVETD